MTDARTSVGAVALALLLVAGGSAPAAVAASPAAQGQPTPVDSCTVIEEPGTYVLTADIRNRSAFGCIRIVASDVTLDGDGHVLGGVGAGVDTVAVSVVPSNATRTTNVTVRNLALADWNDGVRVVGSPNATVRNVTTIDTAFGVSVFESPEATVDGATVRNATVGVAARLSPGTAIRDAGVSGSADGVVVDRSPGASVRGTNVSGNRRGLLVNGSADVTVADVVARGNDLRGFDVLGSPDAAVVDAVVTDTEQVGVSVVDSPNATVAGGVVDGAGGFGLGLVRSNGSGVTDAVLRRNGHAGVGLLETDGATLRNVTVAGTEGVRENFVGVPAGVLLFDSDDNRFENLTLRANAAWDVGASNGSAADAFVDLALVPSANGSLTVDDAVVRSVPTPPPDPPDASNVGVHVLAGGTSPNASLELALDYADDAVADAGVEEPSLRLWRFDGNWSAVPGSGVDVEANRVTGTVDDLGNVSVIAPLGQPANATAGNATTGNATVVTTAAANATAGNETAGNATSQP